MIFLKGYYEILNTECNYLNQNNNYSNKEFLFEFNKKIAKRCNKFIKSLGNKDAVLFTEYDYHHEYGRKSKIFVNERDNLIMFEGYLYD